MEKENIVIIKLKSNNAATIRKALDKIKEDVDLIVISIDSVGGAIGNSGK